ILLLEPVWSHLLCKFSSTFVFKFCFWSLFGAIYCASSHPHLCLNSAFGACFYCFSSHPYLCLNSDFGACLRAIYCASSHPHLCLNSDFGACLRAIYCASSHPHLCLNSDFRACFYCGSSHPHFCSNFDFGASFRAIYCASSYSSHLNLCLKSDFRACLRAIYCASSSNSHPHLCLKSAFRACFYCVSSHPHLCLNSDFRACFYCGSSHPHFCSNFDFGASFRAIFISCSSHLNWCCNAALLLLQAEPDPAFAFPLAHTRSHRCRAAIPLFPLMLLCCFFPAGVAGLSPAELAALRTFCSSSISRMQQEQPQKCRKLHWRIPARPNQPGDSCAVPAQLMNRILLGNTRQAVKQVTEAEIHEASTCPECQQKEAELARAAFLRHKKTLLQGALIQERLEEQLYSRDMLTLLGEALRSFPKPAEDLWQRLKDQEMKNLHQP
uniref:Uncharacterized protein n=1 Tax=Ficedula albicollis TaxID=59894 RepID=A0A803WDH1_FICAL